MPSPLLFATSTHIICRGRVELTTHYTPSQHSGEQMISHLVGIIDHIDKDSLVIEVNGIGYKVNAAASVLNEIGSPGDRVKIFTEHIVREDSESLYGFKNKEEKSLFNSLLSVSGIGPKTAMTISSSYPMDKLVSAISQGNVNLLSSIQGIGKKTAERIVVELKDKIAKTYGVQLSDMAKGIPGEENLVSDAISALITLGYSPKEARDAILKLNVDPINFKNVEDVLKAALKNLI